MPNKNICPIGIEGLKAISKHVPIRALIEDYEDCMKIIDSSESNNNSAAKIHNIINALKFLAKIDIIAGRHGFDCTLDLMAELKKIYVTLSTKFTQSDLYILNEMIHKNNNRKITYTILKDAVTHLFSTLMLRNVAHALNAASHCDAKTIFTFDDLQTLKDQITETDVRLSVKVKLTHMINLKKTTSSFIPKINTIKMFHTRNEGAYTDTNNNNNNNNKLYDIFDKLQSEYAVKIFFDSENLVNQAVLLLKDPELNELKNKNDLQGCLYHFILHHMMSVQKTINTSALLQTKIAEQKNIFELANVASSNIKFQELSEKYDFDKSSEKTYIVAPSSRYQVELLGGGAFHVFKLTDTETGAAIIIRPQLMTPDDLATASSPANLRLRVANSLNNPKPSLTMQYDVIPGVANPILDYRNYEISQAISGEDLLQRFQNLHNVVNAQAKNTPQYQQCKRLLQINFIYFIKQIIELNIALKNAGLCYTDLKPANILIQDNLIKISDIKSLIDISKLKNNECYLSHADQFLPLTGGFYTANSVVTENHRQQIDTDKLIFETICFTAYKIMTFQQLLSSESNSEDQFTPLRKILTPVVSHLNVNSNNENLLDIDQLPIFEDELGKIVKNIYGKLLDLAKSKKGSLEGIVTFINETIRFKKIDLQQEIKISMQAPKEDEVQTQTSDKKRVNSITRRNSLN